MNCLKCFNRKIIYTTSGVEWCSCDNHRFYNGDDIKLTSEHYENKRMKIETTTIIGGSILKEEAL